MNQQSSRFWACEITRLQRLQESLFDHPSQAQENKQRMLLCRLSGAADPSSWLTANECHPNIPQMGTSDLLLRSSGLTFGV